MPKKRALKSGTGPVRQDCSVVFIVPRLNISINDFFSTVTIVRSLN